MGDGGWLYFATCPETTADGEAQNDSQGFPDQDDRGAHLTLSPK